MSEQIVSNIEEWRPVPGFVGQYAISDNGTVRSFRRKHGMHHSHDGIMIGVTNPKGYRRVCLGGKMFYVHRLVLVAFYGINNDRKWANHKNGNPNDNRLDNLEWTTPSENIIHSYRILGRKRRAGEQVWSAKLDPNDVRKIRALCKKGIKQTTIARRFGIDSQTVRSIKNKVSWRHVS